MVTVLALLPEAVQPAVRSLLGSTWSPFRAMELAGYKEGAAQELVASLSPLAQAERAAAIAKLPKAVQPAVSAVSASIITPAQTQYLRTHQLDEAKIILATAQYDHETEDARMLPLKAGAVVVVTEEVQGWWKAVDSEGREGLVPPAYMKEIEKG